MACGGTSATTTWSMSSLKKALPSITASHGAPSRFSTSSSSLTSKAHLKLSRFKHSSRNLSPFLGLTPLNPLIALTCPELNSPQHRFSKIGKGFRVYAMRHGRKVPKLNRPPDQRKALLRGLTTQLFKHGRIVTTEARAKAMRKYADKMITLAKDGSLHKRRQALGFIYEKQLVHALFAEAQERYGDRNGGYTTILKMAMNRRGDNAPLAVVQLL